MTPVENHADKALVLVYDKQCPVCHAYCRRLRIKEADGPLQLVDARDYPQIMQDITRLGFDIDEGVVLKSNDRFYYGADAIHRLALAGSPSTLFNRISIWIFRSKLRAKWLYPALRFCRTVLLKLLRLSKINNLSKLNNQRF